MIAGYLPAGVIANGLRPSLPFVVLLVFLPLARQRQLDDPLSGCDPPVVGRSSAPRRRLPVGLDGGRGGRQPCTPSACGTSAWTGGTAAG